MSKDLFGNPVQPDELLSTQQVSKLTGLSGARVRLLCQQGRFPGALKVSRDWVVPRSGAEFFLRHDRDRRRREFSQKDNDT